MKSRILIVVVVVVAILAAALPVLAAAPAEGTVVEGVSVPGVDLGFTRAQVEAAYGEPASCTNMAYFDGRQGLNGICKFDVEGGGRATTYFYTAEHDPAQGTPDDEVFSIRWEQAVSGWVTTAGVNTTLALNDPQAVIDAYPNAEVTYQGSFVHAIRDSQLGIQIVRNFNVYGGFTTVTMSIGKPSDSEPEPAKYSYVADIDLTAVKIKRNREITAQVLVHDYQDRPAEGAVVSARWLLPDGGQQSVQAVTSGSGYVTFELAGRLDRGNYYLFIDSVQLADHIWNYLSGLRYGSIIVK